MSFLINQLVEIPTLKGNVLIKTGDIASFVPFEKSVTLHMKDGSTIDCIKRWQTRHQEELSSIKRNDGNDRYTRYLNYPSLEDVFFGTKNETYKTVAHYRLTPVSLKERSQNGKNTFMKKISEKRV